MGFLPLLETHCQSVADHYDTLNITVTGFVVKEITGVHVAEVQFIGEVAEQFVNYPKIGFPTGFVVVID